MIYAHLSTGAYAMYDGMTIDTVNALLASQGITCTVITEAQFQAATQIS